MLNSRQFLDLTELSEFIDELAEKAKITGKAIKNVFPATSTFHDNCTTLIKQFTQINSKIFEAGTILQKLIDTLEAAKEPNTKKILAQKFMVFAKVYMPPIKANPIPTLDAINKELQSITEKLAQEKPRLIDATPEDYQLLEDHLQIAQKHHTQVTQLHQIVSSNKKTMEQAYVTCAALVKNLLTPQTKSTDEHKSPESSPRLSNSRKPLGCLNPNTINQPPAQQPSVAQLTPGLVI